MSLLHLLAPFTAFSRGKKFSDQAKGVCDNEISIDLHKTRDPPSDSSQSAESAKSAVGRPEMP